LQPWQPPGHPAQPPLQPEHPPPALWARRSSQPVPPNTTAATSSVGRLKLTARNSSMGGAPFRSGQDLERISLRVSTLTSLTFSYLLGRTSSQMASARMAAATTVKKLKATS